jgi:iron(III) transport system ATP-binding protein
MIVAESLWKSYDNAASVLRGVSFGVKRGEIYTLLGPSGCGKTTSLRALAGLETPDRGRITLGDRVVFSAEDGINLSPDRRRIGMVFQSYAIWPHMTVAGNVAYPLQAQRLAQKDIDRRVGQALEVVGLAHLHDRPAPSLSGGQQQRVALARAIVAEPELLLLDEPLSNLDAKLRGQMRRELAALQRRLGRTTVYVTHDQEEALALSHRIALMRDGEIVEDGDPVSMYEHPRHPFTAAFLGATSLPAPSPVRPGPASASRSKPRLAGSRRSRSAARIRSPSSSFARTMPASLRNHTMLARTSATLA